eukprot:362536-Chlamydomonas_euryale.AAC.7
MAAPGRMLAGGRTDAGGGPGSCPGRQLSRTAPSSGHNPAETHVPHACARGYATAADQVPGNCAQRVISLLLLRVRLSA